VELPSLSVLRNKNSSRLKATLTSLSAVPHAAKQGRQSVTEVVVATGPSGKCFPQYVPSVAKRPKYRSSPAKVDQYIVAIATIRSNRVENASLDLRIYIGRVFLAYVYHWEVTKFNEGSTKI
jgi:hypothetical protein